MGKECYCDKCHAKVKEDEVFLHEGEKYCPECTLEHMRAKHANWYKPPT